jgi:hypothetical protein
MLDWSPGAVKATVGLGGLGFSFYVWFLLEPLLHLDALSLCVAVYRGLSSIDAFFAVPIMIGAWPCLLAARRLKAATAN